MKCRVDKHLIMAYANTMIRDTDYQQEYPSGVDSPWYDRFLTNHSDRLRTAFPNTLDLDREKWTTSANLKTYYDILGDTLLNSKFVVKNPQFDPTEPLDYANLDNALTTQYLWLDSKRSRVISFDETHCTLNQSREKGRTHQDKVVVAVPEKGQRVNAESVSNKSGVDFTMVGGSAVSGQGMIYNKSLYYGTMLYCTLIFKHIALPAMYILKTGFIVSVMEKAPLSGFIDPATLQPFPATFFANVGVGVNGNKSTIIIAFLFMHIFLIIYYVVIYIY